MSIQTRCPKCRKEYLLADTQAGKMVRCRKCDALFPVEDGPPEPAARRRASRGERPARRKRSYLGCILIAAGSAVVVLLFLGLAAGGLAIYFSYLEKEKQNNTPIAMDNGGPAQGGPANAPQPPEPPAENEHDPAEPAKADVPGPDADPANPFKVRVVDLPPADPAKAPDDAGGLAAEVLRKVKNDTVFIRVTMADDEVAEGSGFFALLPGVIVTNAHVVGMLRPLAKKPKEIDVTQNGGKADERKFKAVILGVDRHADLAVLRAKTDKVPPPLDVHSAHGLRETQQVFIVGFPFGSSLGKGVTVSSSTVSSMREDKGVLHRVQVNGGMAPGNSGGPVVDPKGHVVGVSVAGIRGSNVNFAVPGDSVHELFTGRPAAPLGIDQPYYGDADQVSAAVSLRLLDPLNRVRSVAVDVWTGDPGERRPGADKEPAPRPGDSPHQRVSLNCINKTAGGELPLPPLPAGKVYWVQPNWTNNARQTHWDPATVYPLKSPPIRKDSADLVFHQEAGNHPLTLSTKNDFKLFDHEGAERGLLVDMAARLQENVSNVNAQGAEVQLQYGKFDLSFSLDGQSLPLPPHLKDVPNEIRQVTVRLRVDDKGNVVGQPNFDLGQVSGESRTGLSQISSQMQNSLDLLTVPLPNEKAGVGKQWKAYRYLPITSTPGTSQYGNVWMTYTYLGRRKRGGREEAVVRLTGTVRGGVGETMRGRAHGQAVVDLGSGRVIQAEVAVEVDAQTRLSGLDGESEAVGTIEVSMDRTRK